MKIEDYNNFLSEDNFQDFLRTIRKTKPATKEENHEMFLQYQNGNSSMKDQIIIKNLALVVSIAFRMGKNVNKEETLEYIQSGIIGLIEAINLFDTNKNTAFSTYAEYYIHMRINKYRYNNKNLIRRPQYIEEALYKYKNLINTYEKSGEPLPSRNRICSLLDITHSTLKRVEEVYKLDVISMDAPIKNDDSESDNLSEFISGENLEFDNLLDNIVLEEILKTLKMNLPKYEYFILYYRMIQKEPKTFRELSSYFGVTHQAISLTEAKMKSKMENFFSQDHTIKRSYLNEIKKQYPYESIKMTPCSLENYTLFFYLRDKFNEKEQEILKEILLSDLFFDIGRVARKLSENDKYVETLYQSIKTLIKKTSDDIHYKLFHNNLVKKYKNKIYCLDLDSDLSEYFDIKKIISNEWQDKSVEEVFDIVKLHNMVLTKEMIQLIERFYGIAPKKELCIKKEQLERDINFSIYGFVTHEVPLSKLYITFLEKLNNFTDKQKEYLNKFVFKKRKSSTDNPDIQTYYAFSSLNKLFLLYYRIEDYKNDNFTREKYLSVRNQCLQEMDQRSINLLDFYYGIKEAPMTTREIADYLSEDVIKVENEFRKSKYKAITTYLGIGQYYFNKEIYMKVLKDKSLLLGEPHFQISKMFFLEGKTYEEIANEFNACPKFTPRKVSELVRYACNVMDYHRFGITSTQKTYPKEFLLNILQNVQYDEKTKEIIKLYIEGKKIKEISQIYHYPSEKLNNIVRKFNDLANQKAIEKVKITKEDIELSVAEHDSINVLNEREKIMLSLAYGLKNQYNPTGKKKYPIDIASQLGIKNNIGTLIRRALEHVAAHKIGILKTAIDFVNRHELENILRDQRLPLTEEEKNIMINAYGLYDTEFLTVKEIAKKYNIAEPIARKKIYNGVISIKKYLNHEIKGKVLFNIDIKPYLKYFILEDREILELLYEKNKTQLEIQEMYGLSGHQFNLLLQKIQMHLSDLKSGIALGIDFDYFWSNAQDKTIPFDGNHQLAIELCFLYYEKRLSQTDIIQLYHPELTDTTVSKLIKSFTVAVIKHQHGIRASNRFSAEDVLEYYEKYKDTFGESRLKIYRRYFSKIKKNGPNTQIAPNKLITYDLIQEKYPNHFKLENTTPNQVRDILEKYGHTMSKETIQKLESLYGVTHRNLLHDEEWEKIINLLGPIQLVNGYETKHQEKNRLLKKSQEENR